MRKNNQESARKAGKRLLVKQEKFWLFRTHPDGLTKQQTTNFWLWNLGILFLAGICLGLLSLLFAYGEYPNALFWTYFRHPLILFLNLLPVILILFLAYGILGRPWLAFSITSLIVWGFSLGNYYKLRFRDDPLMFQDLKNIREAGNITAKASYDLTPTLRVWFGLICLLLGILFLFFFVRGRLESRGRIVVTVISALLWIPMIILSFNSTIYEQKTENTEKIELWSATQTYFSKGFLYPFLHSITDNGIKAPENYKESDVLEILEQYTPVDIPKEKQVDIIAIQLEGFSDFSRFRNPENPESFENIDGVDLDSAYQTYHQLELESYTGNLITNIFAGGTIDTERAFLTGFADQWNYRSNTNAYGWYFDSQGYTVEGSHPCNEWFYNRRNVNAYLGMPNYYYYENRFHELQEYDNDPTILDHVFIPEIHRLYQAHNNHYQETPYFSFNVTYQGHGPYDTENLWWKGRYTDGRYSRLTTYILDNYLGSVADTGEWLRWLADQLRTETRPVILIAYGDHKPWLGNGNASYQELGINLDLSTPEGFYNYYSTRYLIWANPAAKNILNNDFTGEGPDVSSCFLMNLLFDQCGWTGNAWTQATCDIWKRLPVLTAASINRYIPANSQELTDFVSLSELDKRALETYRCLEYYYGTHFQYPKQEN